MLLSNKKFNPVVTELFIRGRQLNISLVFSTKSYFVVPKNIRLNSMDYFIVKIPKKQELQQLQLFIHQILILKTLYINLYKKCTAKTYSFLIIDATLESDNPLHVRKNLVKRI